MQFSVVFRVGATLIALGALAGCDSAEERAEKHFENGVELMEAGDLDRALVEFRNVFVLDPENIEARMVYADAARDAGRVPESYAAYLRVVEAMPDHLEARLALARLAIESQAWDEAERHGGALIEAEAAIEGVETVKLALAFKQAALENNSATMRELTRQAEDLFADNRDDTILQKFLIEGLARDGRTDRALEVLSVAPDQNPTDRSLYIVRARLLNVLGDDQALEQHLRETVARFPDDDESKALLIRQLAGAGRIDDAEAFLRDQIAQSEAPESSHVTLVTFLRQTRGNEAALDELDAAIETYEANRLFRALRAGIVYDEGDVDDAITIMQGVLDGAEPGEETNRFKITLAKMLSAPDQRPAAQALVEEVMSEDPGHVEALKMWARWQIDGDQPEDALRSLRVALDREPDDPEALMLMSEAHQRTGNSELARDTMALAVEASESAPREALVFARSLFQQERYRPAEDVLVRALRRTPGHVDILVLLGQIHIANQDWGRAEQVEATLRRLNTSLANTRAEELQFQIFGRREGRDRAIAYLEDLIASDEGSSAATVALIRARLADGRGDDALLLAEELVAGLPDNIQAKLVLGNTHIALENFEEAETVIRTTMQDSDDPSIALQLVRVLSAQARADEARNALEAALTTAPDDKNLLWVKASFLENDNQIEDAITIYERMYTQDSSSLVIANNLASLLATYRDDDESLQRAHIVARRLRGTDIPAFQDTYGWILFRRGEYDEAVEYLKPAAEGLPNDPIVQFHLGKALDAIGRQEAAVDAFRDALA
ncbi:MAG: tetratricopeptide repeat protein, partial [Silicimonas sp.]|nr:tetratricopeptide repeat protein [Silicimonas sp.]